MKKQLCLLSALLSASCSLLAFSNTFLANAYTVPDGYTEISVSLMHSFIGDSINAVYLKNDKTFGNMTLNYLYSETLAASDVASASLPDSLVGRSIIWYKGVVPTDQAGVNFFQNPLVVASYNLAFDNVTYMDTGVIQYMGTGDLLALDMNVSTLRQYNYLTYSFDSGFSTYYMDARRSDSSKPGFFRTQQWPAGYYFGFQNIWQSSTPSQFVFGDQSASMLYQEGGSRPGVTMGIICPIVNSDYIFGGNDVVPKPPSDSSGSSSGNASGTIVDKGDGTHDINIKVETDNSGLIAGLLDGLKNLFIPSDDQLKAFTDGMNDLAVEHLGGLKQAIDILDNSFSDIDQVTARTSIHVDGVNIPLLRGQSISIGNWDVNLKPSNEGGFGLLYTAIALFADFIASFAFLRMCRNKLEIILNPNSEVIKE